MKKKKIGIITFHTAINYGVHLQAFSLVHIANKLGYQAEVIDYRKKVEKSPSKLKKLYEWIIGFDKIIANKIYNRKPEQQQRRMEFDRFDRENLCLSAYCNNRSDVEEISKEYDALICGSDQIWNPSHTHGNGVYFCDTISREKRIAYAPSFGVKEIPKDYIELYRNRISDMKYISVREEAGRRLIQNICGRDCKVVVDPTLLVSKQSWQELSDKVPSLSFCDNYVLCYFLGNQNIINEIGRVWKSKGVNVINISQHGRLFKNSNIIEVYPSIEEFLYLYKNATMVYTDSYHGTMFSLINEKNFYAFSRNDTKADLNSRIENVLSKLNLMDRLVANDCKSVPAEMNINYKKVNTVLDEWIADSMAYLEDSIRSACGE